MAVLPTGIGPVTGYQIERSLRFNSADSAYLNRTPASATNQQKWTWSGWVKRSALGSFQRIFTAVNDANDESAGLRFDSSDRLDFIFMQDGSSSITGRLVTTAVYRDVSAWYHIVFAQDTTNATSGDRLRLWVNGTEVTVFTTDTAPTQNHNGYINSTNVHRIGSEGHATAQTFSGYLTEQYLIDGQALTPSSFGETDSNTGVWKPKAFSGTYGTNGFYLKFADNSGTTSTTLGKDSSGNGNNWTPNNFSVTAGAGNDSLVDSPTSYGTDTGVGGEVRGNYATLNPLNTQISGSSTLQNGNLTLNATSATYVNSKSTLAASTFNNYCEMTVTTQSNSNGLIGIGVGNSIANIATGDGSYIAYRQSGSIIQYPGNVTLATVASYTQGDVIGMTIDSTNVKFYKNNSLQGTYAHGFTGDYFVVGMAYNNGGTAVLDFNFGQRAFAYTAPSGFKALCTQNLPTPTIGATSTTQANDYFNAVLYTGTGSARSVTGIGFQPDFVWLKSRTEAYLHVLTDAVRGATKTLQTDATAAEITDVNDLTSFDSDGFSVGTNNRINKLNNSHVSWNWKANGAGSSNTAGTITSTVSANTTSGFSVVTYTGTGSNATVGHGLGVAPSMVIVKMRSGIQNWVVYHTSLGNTKALFLDLTDAAATNSLYWNNTSPTSSLITLGSGNGTNASGSTYVAYCFAPVAGYSAFGSYTGNGSADGVFVYTGFRPSFILTKRTDSANYWMILDDERRTYNPAFNGLYPNLSDAEGNFGNSTGIDFLSNGFKLRDSVASVNASGGTYIYMAVAESPFKYSLAR